MKQTTRDPKGNTPLGYASEYGHAAVAQLLIKAGADINAKNDAGVAPLHYACLYGNKNIVEMLVANGVDINAPVVKEGTEWTALQFAEHGQHREIVDFLLQHNAIRGRIR
jgi:ankyrin repeat protein